MRVHPYAGIIRVRFFRSESPQTPSQPGPTELPFVILIITELWV